MPPPALVESSSTTETPQALNISACFDVLTISGQSGTLKTSVAKGLASLLPEVDIYHRGNDLRKSVRDRTGEEIVGAVPAGYDQDEQLDAQTKHEIAQAYNTGRPAIIEGRLAGIVLSAERPKYADRDPTLRALAVLTLSDNEEKRAHRIARRQNAPEAAVAAQTAERQQADRERWQHTQRELLDGQDPFDPFLKDPAGHDVYDLALLIDHQPNSLHMPSGPTKEAMISRILQELTSRGLAELRSR